MGIDYVQVEVYNVEIAQWLVVVIGGQFIITIVIKVIKG